MFTQMRTNLKIRVKWVLLIIASASLIGCGDGRKSDVNEALADGYSTYENHKYGYAMEYPNMLTPQGEAESGDGQTFASEDGSALLRVYHDFRSLSGELDPISKAFADDMARLQPTEQKLHESHYEMSGINADEKLFSQITMQRNNAYFTLEAEYNKNDAELYAEIMRHAFESFQVASDEVDPMVAFLFQFINECYWSNNFNKLLRDGDGTLIQYIDPQIGIRRYYNPGTIAYLYGPDENYGFDDYTDFAQELEAGGEYNLSRLDLDEPICHYELRDANGYFIAYYGALSELPQEMVDPETFETRPIQLPYPNAELLALYLPSVYNDNVFPRGFYFVNTPNGWKLAFVDDSLCSA